MALAMALALAMAMAMAMALAMALANPSGTSGGFGGKNMSDSLPPGVTNAMIPGNRPEDLEWEIFWQWAGDQLYDAGISVEDAYRVINNGLKTVNN